MASSRVHDWRSRPPALENINTLQPRGAKSTFATHSNSLSHLNKCPPGSSGNGLLKIKKKTKVESIPATVTVIKQKKGHWLR